MQIAAASYPVDPDRAPRSDAAPSGKPESFDSSPEEAAQVRQLQRRDQEVRRHEAAHLAAGGALAQGGATYSYQSGPDGKCYAVGGEVSVDTSRVAGDPAATIAKMQTVRRAALAPADPSGQDFAVAARAAETELAARAQLAAAGPSTGGADTPAGAGDPPLAAPGGLVDTYG